MRNILSLVIICGLFLGGCQHQRMTNSLDLYIGSSVAYFVADHGYPSSSVKLSDTESSFRWIITGQGIGAVVPLGNALVAIPPQQKVCTIDLRATSQSTWPELKDWTIRSWRWQGAC